MKNKDDEGSEDNCSQYSDEDKGRAPRKQVECIMGQYTLEQLRSMHPQRSTYNFKMGNNPVTITSNFDAGNMARCEQLDSGNHVSFIFLITNSF